MEYFSQQAREHDLPFRSDGDALNLLDEQRTALVYLADAVSRCQHEDMRTPEVLAALEFLRASLLPDAVPTPPCNTSVKPSPSRIPANAPKFSNTATAPSNSPPRGKGYSLNRSFMYFVKEDVSQLKEQ